MILVTGGTGFLGSHLLYSLIIREEKVRAIYRSKDKIDDVKKIFSLYTDDKTLISKIQWFKADITNILELTSAFLGIDKIYHCAALVSFDLNKYKEMRKVNIDGTANIVNIAIDSNVKKICFVSSIASIGDSINNNLISEENEWDKESDNSDYSITKFGSEMEIWRASQEGVDVVIVNPGVILGSGFWNYGSSKLFSKVNDRLNYYTEGITGFVGVKDVVNIMNRLMDSDIKNERFILVSENKSFKEILFLIAKYLEKKPPSFKIHAWQTSILNRVCAFISFFTSTPPLINKYTARSMHSVSKYSSLKIQKTLGYKFSKIDDVIKEISNDFKKYINRDI